MRDIVFTSSILILTVLLIRYLAKDRLAPTLRYALWLPVVLRLLLPIPLWNSQFSVLNFIPDSQIESSIAEEMENLPEQPAEDKAVFAGMESLKTEKGNPEKGNPEKGNPEKEDLETAEAGNGTNAAGTDDTGNMQSGQNHFMQEEGGFQAIPEQNQHQHVAAALPNHWFFLSKCLPYIWAAGMLLVGGYMLFYQIRWQNYLRANRRPLGNRRKYRGKLSVYTVGNLPSPCLAGRCIYLTEEMAKEPEQMEHILAHEYCHYRQFDSLWVVVRCVLTVVYWFHPLVWAAAYVSKQDSELACDAAAIRLLGEKERIPYGKTLLRLIAGNGHDRSRIGLASTMSGGEKGIRERISHIARKPQYMVITAGVVVLLIAAVIAVTFSGTKEAGENGGQMEGAKDLPALADPGNEQEMELSAEQEQMQKELEVKLAEEQKQLAALEAQQAALEKEQSEAAERERGVLEKLASYDADIDVLGSREGVFGIVGAMNPSDYVQVHYEKGDEALEEGMYLLETHKGSDSSDIKVYGMYSKEYGCEGIKILIGDDVNDFDEKWCITYLHNLEGNLRLYESAEDGMPRTFACKVAVTDTSDSELWNLCLCDRYDTGTIEQYTVRPEELFGQIRERLRFEIHTGESRIDIYDNGQRAGSVSVDASSEAMENISGIIVDDSSAGWELGSSEDEIRMILSIGLKLKTTDDIWYGRLPLLSIPVSCGSFGDRKIEIGQASAETAYVSGKGMFQVLQAGTTLDQYLKLVEDNSRAENSQNDNSHPENADTELLVGLSADGGSHYDVEIQYVNPCPSYTRISDPFGIRTHPATGEKMAHNGIDLAAEKGTDVLAAADGTVYEAGFDTANGNYVILYHVMSGEYTYYTHCQEILVAEGSSVTAGQKIATVGSTGDSTGPHLHFALSRDGEYREPVFE